MESSFLYRMPSFLIALLLLILMMLVHGVAHQIRIRSLNKKPSSEDGGFGPVEGSLLGLLALLLSFTFSMSSSRYDNRVRAMVVEANSIRTAILRADIFPDSLRRSFQNEFNKYVEARISLYEAGMNEENNRDAYRQTAQSSSRLWALATGAAKSRDGNITAGSGPMINALTDMINNDYLRRSSRETTVPDSIVWLLLVLCLAASFIVGYGNKKDPDWILVFSFSLMISIAVFSILDLDHPHSGLINLDGAERHFIELRDLIGNAG
jgi:hypothetical protein